MSDRVAEAIVMNGTALYNIGFVLEQALGHVTHAKNLQTNVARDPDVRAHWALIPFETHGLAARIPLYKSNWTVRAGLRARRSLSRLTRHATIDALFFHTQVPAVLAADWMRRYPSVVSLDATPLQYDQLGAFYQHDPGPPWLERIKWQLNRRCFCLARHLVTWSQWAKEGLIEGYGVPADKITVIPPGVNVHEWQRPTPRAPHEGPVKLLFVGANLERKGGLLLLEAFRRLRPLVVELHLVTKDQVPDEPGVFVYHGMQPNSAPLKALYHQADIFVLPTFGDCLPMVLSEAAAAGLPAISTRVAAIPEIVRDNETGLLVPPGDVSALTEALRRLVLRPDERLRFGEQALSHVARMYDARHNAGRLLDVIKGEIELSRIRERIPA
ncbi:glycosyltransferase family 4 protein [Chloroflexus aggregans]|nr:glycosyltransferase family 4 protein [Chloroflexus aggregans]